MLRSVKVKIYPTARKIRRLEDIMEHSRSLTKQAVKALWSVTPETLLNGNGTTSFRNSKEHKLYRGLDSKLSDSHQTNAVMNAAKPVKGVIESTVRINYSGESRPQNVTCRIRSDSFITIAFAPSNVIAQILEEGGHRLKEIEG